MRQQGINQIKLWVPCRSWLALVLATFASAQIGCALPERIDEAKCRIPPNYPHEFAAPVSYGYYQTRWNAWPGAESVPGYTMSRKKPEGTTGRSEEQLPPPSSEGGEGPPLLEQESPFGPRRGDNVPDFGNAFDEPAPPSEEMQTEPPRIFEPRRPEELAPPGNEPPTEGEPLPESLVPDEGSPQSPAEPMPDQGAWNLEMLPSDAPDGTLIPEDEELARRSVPGLLMPEKERGSSGRSGSPRNETVKRPSPVRGASATERLRERNLRSSRNAPRRPTGVSDGSDEGPQLFAPAATDAAASSGAAPTEKWLTIDPPSATATQATTDAAISQPSAASAAWHRNPVRDDSTTRVARQSPAADRPQGWQPRGVRPVYPEMQTGNVEPVAAKPIRATEAAHGESSNPLR